MRIIFVRHGHPNYEKDCLTELGHEHAHAAALRLQNEGIVEIHASSSGRAAETAQHTADLLGLPVTLHDFIREISWGAKDGGEIPFKGNPWFVSDQMVRDGIRIMEPNWRHMPPYDENNVDQYVDKVEKGIDEWLAHLGYAREGDFYRVTKENTDRTIAMFSHAGASSAALSHLLNIPFSYFCTVIAPDFTAITVLKFSDVPGELTAPKIEIMNDSRHIHSQGITIGR